MTVEEKTNDNSGKKRVRRSNKKKTAQATELKDLVVIAFCIGLMLLIYTGCRDVLVRMATLNNIIYLPPSQPLGLILMPLFAMLLFSNSVVAIGTLYLSSDLELLLSSPLNNFRFFYNKFFYILFNSSWMPLIFMLPVLLAFGISYQAGADYFAAIPLLIIPYFLLPTAIAIFVATIFTVIIPANRTKEVLLVCILILLVAAYQLIDILGLSSKNISNIEEILRLVSLFSMSNLEWLPSNWIAKSFEQLLTTDGRSFLPELLAIYCSSAAAISLAFMAVDKLHGIAYSKAHNIKQNAKLSGKGLRKQLRLFCPFLAQHKQALLAKEYRLLARDITQTVQLAMLLALCLIYIYNLRIFGALDMLPEGMRGNWRNFFFIGNVAMGSFITTAICTRFVYPSISLEGKAYWLLVSGPLDIAELIKVKFFFWFVPISLVSATFFAVGAYIIGANYWLISVNIISAMAICYGIVGLGIGMGALFADFDWEHSSELAASFGSFAYMLVSIFLILCSIVPATVLLILHQQSIARGVLTSTQWIACLLIAMFLLCGLNFLTARISVKVGERALRRRLSS